MRVAVFGATGTIGRPLLPVLAAEHEVVAVSRRPQPPGPEGVRWAVAEATEPEAVRRALEGVEAAYYLVHSLGRPDFEARDLLAAETVATEAARAGVSQLVYLGGLGDDDPGLSAHLRSRRETGRRLAAGDVPVTTLRAAMVVGRGSAAFETIVALVDRLPAMVCPRWISTPTQPIALTDALRYLAGVCGLPGALGRSFDAGGPEVMAYREMIERVARLRGRLPWIVEVPVLTPRLSSLWLHLVTPVRAGVARPLIEGLRNPTVAREEAIRVLLPGELVTFDEAAADALR
ncbi:MAG: NAD(P)H-binding protein [Actinobacteria bacterium]|nr:NAD(P)H-binding protein [Actinomycetota bacterium]